MSLERTSESTFSVGGPARRVNGPMPDNHRNRSATAPATVSAAAEHRSVPRWLREVLLLGSLYALYEASRGIDSSDPARALARGRALLSWEQAWDLAPEAGLNSAVAHLTPLAVLAAYFYSTLHYVVTPAVLLWMYRRHGGHYRSARTALVLGTALGLVGFYLLPTAPPRLVAGSGLRDTLADVSRWGWWGSEGSVPRGLGGLSNQLAAMPSLHVGWALWSGVLIGHYASRRSVRLLGASYPVATTLVVLATGNHYLVDAVGGLAVMVAGAGGARLLRRDTSSTISSDTSSETVADSASHTTAVRAAGEAPNFAAQLVGSPADGPRAGAGTARCPRMTRPARSRPCGRGGKPVARTAGPAARRWQGPTPRRRPGRSRSRALALIGTGVDGASVVQAEAGFPQAVDHSRA